MNGKAYWSAAAAIASAAAILATGCDSATSTASSTDTSAGSDTSGDTASCPFTYTGIGTGNIVINEVQGKVDDWVELHNKGTTTASLAGFSLSDGNAEGCPDLGEALTFPADATIAAGGYLLIEAGKKTPEIGITTKCIAGGPETCYQAAFKLSAGGGDQVFLLQGKNVIDSVQIPAGVLLDGTQTYGRLPNGSGAFKVASPTPGFANKGL